jgi:16S rRNA (guanine966-N2)-methyltransferase
MFNALVSLGVLDEAVVIDLFAGSGALGIEALSRGAARCTFVEGNARAVAVIRRNVQSLGLEDRSEIVGGRVETVLRTLGAADVILADPPYGYDQWPELLSSLEGALAVGGTVVIESGADIESIVVGSGRWDLIRSKKYGRTWVSFLQRI